MTKQDALRSLWDSLESEVLAVTSDEGEQMVNGQMREAAPKIWLYVDDMDGFQLISSAHATILLKSARDL